MLLVKRAILGIEITWITLKETTQGNGELPIVIRFMKKTRPEQESQTERKTPNYKIDPVFTGRKEKRKIAMDKDARLPKINIISLIIAI